MSNLHKNRRSQANEFLYDGDDFFDVYDNRFYDDFRDEFIDVDDFNNNGIRLTGGPIIVRGPAFIDNRNNRRNRRRRCCDF